MQFKLIDPDAPEYEEARMLRWEVLKKPLGLPPGSELLEEEGKSLHMVAIEKKQVVGCVCFCSAAPQKGEIYQMAVSEEYRGKGFGRQLIHMVEQMLLEKGVNQLYVYVGDGAEGFYEKMGYCFLEECIEKHGASCRLMKKQLENIKTTDVE